jgi:hypothetical protein
MRAFLMVLLTVPAACRIERIDPGSAGRTAAPDPADSAIVAALETYYDRFSRRAWSELRTSFWPGALITTRWQAPGAGAPAVELIPLDTFLARTGDGPDRLAIFDERMVRHEIRRYGDLASVWATFRATFGMPGESPATHWGIDAFHLMRDGDTWRIVSLAFTGEQPGDSLPKERPAP